jgi:hypothetical protein
MKQPCRLLLPILEAGKRYRLEASRDWRDEEGRRLDGRLSREFLAGPPDEAQPDPSKWTIAAEGGLVRVATDGPLDPESLRKRVVVPNSERGRPPQWPPALNGRCPAFTEAV